MSSWLLGINDDNKWCIEDANSYRTIADDIEQKQDARLIASAPEMYELIKKSLCVSRVWNLFPELNDYARELIARIDSESYE